MYHHIMEMNNSQSLRNRVMGCAAQEGHPDPRGFVDRNMLNMAKDPTWVLEWEKAEGKQDTKFNPDTGARTDVITDAMILAVAQPLVITEIPA
jgi:hypothetical protein